MKVITFIAFCVVALHAEERNGEINEGMFEGDIKGYNPRHRGAMIGTRWPGGRVPYKFQSSFPASSRKAVEAAMADMAKRTCITFVKPKASEHYIKIVEGSGCYSYLGHTSGPSQPLSLARGCLLNGRIQHEIMHALGFVHEQNRPDRDQYVQIKFDNIQQGRASQFKMEPKSKVTTQGTKYDYGSVMHYGANYFSKDRKSLTIIAPKGKEIGQRKGMTATDVKEINMLYECNADNIGKGSGGITDNGGGGGNEDCTDSNESCSMWAKYGHCKKNPGYMLPNCKKSCDSC
jgi:hypothetical protein